MSSQINIIGIGSLPEIRFGDNLGHLIIRALEEEGVEITSGEVLVVTQKVVSKSEGRVINLSTVEPSDLACEIALEHERDPRHTEVILRESKRIVRMDRGVIISETRHGFRCANAGVDASNVDGDNSVALLPKDPDASARSIRMSIKNLLGIDVAVIISDTFGRPWREGATNVSIGLSGISALMDYRGKMDRFGYPLRTTTIAVADELAAAAELVMGKLDNIPVALIKGYSYTKGGSGVKDLIRPAERDLFR